MNTPTPHTTCLQTLYVYICIHLLFLVTFIFLSNNIAIHYICVYIYTVTSVTVVVPTLFQCAFVCVYTFVCSPTLPAVSTSFILGSVTAVRATHTHGNTHRRSTLLPGKGCSCECCITSRLNQKYPHPHSERVRESERECVKACEREREGERGRWSFF